jgi:acyl-[acyl carrier protein]--UDP-N-acetylglucosamine O-acyltransferase
MTINSGIIHPTAIVSEQASLGENVSVGPYSIIHGGVTIGSETQIGSHCEIGVPTKLAKDNKLTIGEASVIRSHSVLYIGSIFGDRFITGHRVTIRENTVTGINFQLGTLSDIQGDCVIGDYVRFHSNVHIGKSSRIGNYVWIFPYVVLTNDPHPPSDVLLGVNIGDFAVIATMSTILPGINVSEGALVGAHSLVNRDVPPNMIVAGVPAKQLGPTDKIKLTGSENISAYPWRKHFHRGYPEDIISDWNVESYE